MSRTNLEIHYTCTPEEARHKVEASMTIQGYQKTTYKNGEEAWTAGSGFFALPKFIKFDYAPGVLHVTAWVCNALGGNELSIEKCPNFFAKRNLRNTLQKLMTLLQ